MQQQLFLDLGDVIAAADHLREQYQAPQLLIGHSLGGAAVLAAAQHVPEAKAVATIGALFDPAHVSRLFKEAREEIEAEGEAEVVLAGRTFTAKAVSGGSERAVLGRADRRPEEGALDLHAPLDAIVGIDNAGEIFKAARHPKSFVSLDGADHLLTLPGGCGLRRRSAGRLGEPLLAGSDRSRRLRRPEGGEVLVAETGQGRFQQVVRVGRHDGRTSQRASVATTPDQVPMTTCLPASAPVPR